MIYMKVMLSLGCQELSLLAGKTRHYQCAPNHLNHLAITMQCCPNLGANGRSATNNGTNTTSVRPITTSLQIPKSGKTLSPSFAREFHELVFNATFRTGSKDSGMFRQVLTIVLSCLNIFKTKYPS